MMAALAPPPGPSPQHLWVGRAFWPPSNIPGTSHLRIRPHEPVSVCGSHQMGMGVVIRAVEGVSQPDLSAVYREYRHRPA
eukprot:COSAG01_NODE_1479_length_10161_cov_138.934109_8_plen_80_part_00